eukprot:sb/3468364/
MMDKLHEALRFCKNLDPSCSRGCDRLIRLLDNRLVDVKSKKKVPKSDCLEKLDFVRDIKPELIAAQLTHIEIDFLNNISFGEIISMLGKDVSKDKDPATAWGNVEKYVNWFNHLSHFVATEVLSPELGAARNLTMEYYMDTAVACFSQGNFNSAMAILAGLNQPGVKRTVLYETNILPLSSLPTSHFTHKCKGGLEHNKPFVEAITEDNSNEIEAQLHKQKVVNTELKRLLIASVGDNLATNNSLSKCIAVGKMSSIHWLPAD